MNTDVIPKQISIKIISPLDNSVLLIRIHNSNLSYMAETLGLDFFGNSQTTEQPLIKTLKVVNKPYKNKYTVGLNIQGEYLKAYGFNRGDMVEMQVAENLIKISKVINEN